MQPWLREQAEAQIELPVAHEFGVLYCAVRGTNDLGQQQDLTLLSGLVNSEPAAAPMAAATLDEFDRLVISLES